MDIVVLDDPGYGFNDSTVVTEVGGNTGTTLGEQRLNVLQWACDIWASYLHSDVPIRVEARFLDMGGSPSGYSLASASAISLIRNFTYAPDPDVWYPVALANSLEGTDLSSDNDISVSINIALDLDPAIPDWYYGLDGDPTSGTTELLDVLLHELAHGLGFASYADESAGTFPDGYADIFSTFLYDTEYDAFWPTMKRRIIKRSAVNDPNLTWAGSYTQAAMGHILDPERVIEVTTPPGIAGQYSYEAAQFGPAVPDDGVTSLMVVVQDEAAPLTDACDPLVNGGELSGNIAYIDRGSCNFDAKVLKAQQAGAVAVIIANNTTGGPVVMAGEDIVDGVTLNIPAVSISLEDGLVLTGESGVTLTIGTSTGVLPGTNGGFVRMYAPKPLELGSSVSHWSPDASPDLLMEPFINPDLRDDLDLSLTLMKDIGWTVIDIPFPHMTYQLYMEQSFAAALGQDGPGDDPDGDGILNIEEYFFGGDPDVHDEDILPRIQLIEPDLDYVYTRSTSFTDLDWGYEVSTDMVGWEDAVDGVHYTEEIVESLDGSYESVKLRLVRPAPGQKIFVRIRINPQ